MTGARPSLDARCDALCSARWRGNLHEGAEVLLAQPVAAGEHGVADLLKPLEGRKLRCVWGRGLCMWKGWGWGLRQESVSHFCNKSWLVKISRPLLLDLDAEEQLDFHIHT